MADSFDPYYQWLGIEPVDQPPHHYRLLAIAPFMDNREVIAGASDRQMAHLRTFQRGPQAADSQRLLNQVSIAKVCLLNPDKKTAYDEQLRTQLARGAGGASRWILIGAAAAVLLIALGGTAIWMSSGPSKDGQLAERDKKTKTTNRAEDGSKSKPNGGEAAKSNSDAAWAPKEATAAESTEPGANEPSETNPPVTTSPDETTAPQEVPDNTTTDQTPGDEKSSPESKTPTDTADPAGKQPVDNGDSPPATPPDDASPKTKLPIPELALQQKAQAEVKTVFEYDKATERADRLRLASQMIDEALQTDDDRTVQFVMLRISRDLGNNAGDVKTAFRAIDELDERFMIDAVAMRVQAIAQVLRGNLSATERKQVVLHGLILVDELLLADQFQSGGRLTTQMGRTADALRDKSLSDAVDARRKRGSSLFKKYKLVEPAVLTLETKPDDPQANSQVGMYRCFVQGDWKRGLAMLARGSDAELKQVALSEKAGPSTATEQAALGDAWLELAENTADEDVALEMKVRAASWYRGAVEGLTGFGRRRVEKRLNLLANLKSALPGSQAHADLSVESAATPKLAGYYKYYESKKKVTATGDYVTIQLAKDGKVIAGGKAIATWRAEDDQLSIIYFDRALGNAQLKEKIDGGLLGTRTDVGGERSNVGLLPVRVVGVWEDVHSGGKVIERLVLYSNERVNDPLGEVVWSRTAWYLRIDKTQMTLRDNDRLFSGWREEEKAHYGRWLTTGILLDTRKTVRGAVPPAAPPKLSAKEEDLLIATYEMVGATKGSGRSVSLTVDLKKDGRLMDHEDEIGLWTHEGGRVTMQFIDPRLGVANLRLKSRSDLVGNSTGSGNDRWIWEFKRVKSRTQVINNKKVILYNNFRLDDPHAGKGYWYMSRGKPVLLNSW
jgi:hypothetical protein